MKAVQLTATLHKFGEQGEKTGWTYVSVPQDVAEELSPGTRKSFRVSGKIDAHKIEGVALLPMGDGSFILPVNASMRKGIAKKEGAQVRLSLQLALKEYELNALLTEALAVSAKASEAFYKMPRSHQNYYSKWVDSAKTETTVHKRLTAIVISLERGMSYAEMLREQAALNAIR